MFGKIICLVLFFQIFTTALSVRNAKVEGPVVQPCLACICDASSSCNVELYSSNGMRGPLRITEPYWIDGGQPTMPGASVGSSTAFENCANDVYCSGLALQGYMEKYGRDCNEDGLVNCDDFAAIHRFGPFACNQDLPEDFKRRYTKCKRVLASQQHEI